MDVVNRDVVVGDQAISAIQQVNDEKPMASSSQLKMTFSQAADSSHDVLPAFVLCNMDFSEVDDIRPDDFVLCDLLPCYLDETESAGDKTKDSGTVSENSYTHGNSVSDKRASPSKLREHDRCRAPTTSHSSDVKLQPSDNSGNAATVKRNNRKPVQKPVNDETVAGTELRESSTSRRAARANRNAHECTGCSQNPKTSNTTPKCNNRKFSKQNAPDSCRNRAALRQKGQCPEYAGKSDSLKKAKIDRDDIMFAGMYDCEYCGRKFADRQQLMKHKSSVHADSIVSYMCDICYKTFNSRIGFSHHCKVHVGYKPYSCEVCKKSFSHVALLNQHKRTHSGSWLTSTCEVCGKGFPTQRHLTVHSRVHTGERPYGCDLCDKSFSQATTLACHRRTHTNERPFVCDFCGKTFRQPVALTYHKRTHTGEKPYKCDKCDKAFSQAGPLAYHKRTHTGEKKYQCDMCDMRFIQSSALESHRRTHTGCRPYKCSLCDKAFTQSVTLKYHQRTHTGVKPFKCPLCDMAFSQARPLERHKQTHVDSVYVCDMCDRSFSCSKELVTHRNLHP